MEETIRICLEKGYLVDFLQAHREEVTTMMDELFGINVRKPVVIFQSDKPILQEKKDFFH